MEGIIIAVVFIAALVIFGLVKLNQSALKKMDAQKSLIEQNKQTVSIFVIDKKKEKVQNSNLPKAVIAQMPKAYKFIKMHLVKAKVGAQITTLMCDKKVYNALEVNRTAKVDIAGLYISNVKGMKTDEELKQIKKAQKDKEKAKKKDK